MSSEDMRQIASRVCEELRDRDAESITDQEVDSLYPQAE